jgi:hypothetical protein
VCVERFETRIGVRVPVVIIDKRLGRAVIEELGDHLVPYRLAKVFGLRALVPTDWRVEHVALLPRAELDPAVQAMSQGSI